ncbi:MAG: nucleotidyltransferase, partial [Vicinamibacteraceae bacterium]|nr:nucleotidyltransferase [Vicinamibacteraceae bacterium]
MTTRHTARRKSALYRRVLAVLSRAGVPALLGGTYAVQFHTGIERPTKDLDLFVEEHELERVRAAVEAAGLGFELAFPHWLAKVRHASGFVDLVFNSGNGLVRVDASWFTRAPHTRVFGVAARVVPLEELIWSKAFVMERERYDGADVAHLLLARSAEVDWPHLVARFGPHGTVLLAHLLLFRFIYPGHARKVPADVVAALFGEAQRAASTAPLDVALCRGTLLSREQYLVDVREHGFVDARCAPDGAIPTDQLEVWTADIRRPPVVSSGVLPHAHDEGQEATP